MDTEEFRKTKRNILKKVDKVIRYQNHTAFIGMYLKMDVIPKGFALKFHNNIDFDSKVILKKCSKKLMKRTLTHYQEKMKEFCKEIETDEEKISIHHPSQYDSVRESIRNKRNSLSSKIQTRHKKKFQRDGLPIQRASEILCSILKKCQEKWSTTNTPKNELMKDVEIPCQDPIILTDNPKFQETAFKSLCQKGPSFVPTPKSVNWTQLQLDFDKFRNMIRREIFFSNNNTPATTTHGPPKPSSQWSAPKSNIPDVEMFLKYVERDIFSDTTKKKTKTNLTKDEDQVLSYCMNEVLFNHDSTVAR